MGETQAVMGARWPSQSRQNSELQVVKEPVFEK